MRTCFYDEFRAYIDQCIKEYTDLAMRGERIDFMLREAPDDPAVQQFLLNERNGIDLRSIPLDPPPELVLVRQQLRLVQPRILTQQIGELAVNLLQKAGLVEAPFIPFQALPFWVEFDQGAISDDLDSVRAMFVISEGAMFRVFLITEACTYTSMLLKPDGSWIFEPIGPCSQESCSFSARTQTRYRIASEEAKPLMQQHCVCATAGWNWSQFLVETDQETPREPAGIYLFGTDGQAYRAFEIEATLSALTQEGIHSQHERTGSCTVVHPEYDFLTFDDLLTPTKMTVWLTSKRFESDLEDNRRCGIAQEIKCELQERGCSLEVTFERETEAPVVSDERIITIKEGDLGD